MKDVGYVSPAVSTSIGFLSFHPQEDEPEKVEQKTPVPWLLDDVIHVKTVQKHTGRKIATVYLLTHIVFDPNPQPHMFEPMGISNIFSNFKPSSASLAVLKTTYSAPYYPVVRVQFQSDSI